MKLTSVALLASVALFSSARAAADVVDECTDAARDGQVARDEGKLLAARRAFARCASADCPDAIRRDCAGWIADVDERTPTVVVTVRAGSVDAVDARVTLDGAELALRGQALPLDPGRHLFVAERSGKRTELAVLLVENQKGRAVELQLDADAPPPPPPSRTQTYVGWGLLGAGAAIAVASGITFGVAWSHYEGLKDCSPSCSDHAVATTRSLLIATDVTAAIALVTLGVGLVVWLTAPKAQQSAWSPGGATIAF